VGESPLSTPGCASPTTIGDQLGASVFTIHGAGLFMRLANSLGTACRIEDAFRRSAEFRSL
jgi:hypothetical protein